MRLPSTTGDAPLPPDEAPLEEPYEPPEPYDPSELLGPGELPDELDLRNPAERDPGHDEIPGEEIDEIFPDMSKIQHRSADGSARGGQVTLQKLTETPQKCIFQRFLGKMTETRERKRW